MIRRASNDQTASLGSGRVSRCRRWAPRTALLWIVFAAPFVARADDESAAIEKRLSDAARYLSSDELEGRNTGSKGVDEAADYIAQQFAEVGLKTELFDGTPMQGFALSGSSEIGPDNSLTFAGPNTDDDGKAESVELKPGVDFIPMSTGSAKFDLPLVFVGYGITGEEEGYDDYADVDVKGKMVVILRHEPQQADPQSAFAGTKDSKHAPFRRKIANAAEHGAAGVIFCTDRFDIDKTTTERRKAWQGTLDRLAAENEKFKKIENPTVEQIEAQCKTIGRLIVEVKATGEKFQRAYDPLMPFGSARGGQPSGDFPVVHCRREALDRIATAALDTSLAELEKQIDQGPTPQSRELPGWKAVGQTDVRRPKQEAKNVVGVLEGEGPLAEQTLVIGAHYDHVGVSGPAGILSRLFGGGTSEREVFNGADDNASGTAALIEVARSLAGRDKKLGRRVVFIAFGAEERGLIGSRHYVNNPLYPLEETVAMLNMDMVGRLRDGKLTISGCGTAKLFDGLLDRINEEHELTLTKTASGYGPSDHASFYGKKIPVLHFFTGMHGDVHRPTDEFEKLNVPGMRRVTCLVTDVVEALAESDQRPEYVTTGRASRPGRGGPRAYLGTTPDFSADGPGFAISDVATDGPAQTAGIKGGDAIIRFGDAKIEGLEDIDAALRKHKPGDRVKVVLRRGEEEITVEVTLAKRP